MPFKPSLIFVGKARSLPWRGAPERFFTRVGSCLTLKRYIILEKACQGQTLSDDKNLLLTTVKSFITLARGVKVIKLFLFVTDDATK